MSSEQKFIASIILLLVRSFSAALFYFLWFKMQKARDNFFKIYFRKKYIQFFNRRRYEIICGTRIHLKKSFIYLYKT